MTQPPLIEAIDLFAGCGGLTTGAHKVPGVKVVAAVNHWSAAVESHAANHPYTKHYCQDVRLVDYRKVLRGHNVKLGLAAPDCRGHTRAKGKEKKDSDKARETAWGVIELAESLDEMEYLVVENVVEITRWKFFDLWTEALRRLDFHLSISKLNAITHGVPQNRERAFICGIRGGRKAPKIEPLRLAPVGADTILALDDGEWSYVEQKANGQPRAPATLRKIQATRDKYGDVPFTLPYYGATKRGRPITRPIGALTTHDRHAVVKQLPTGRWVMRMISVAEQLAAMGFDKDYILLGDRVDQVRMIGGCVSPVVATNVVTQLLAA